MIFGSILFFSLLEGKLKTVQVPCCSAVTTQSVTESLKTIKLSSLTLSTEEVHHMCKKDVYTVYQFILVVKYFSEFRISKIFHRQNKPVYGMQRLSCGYLESCI